MTITWFHVKVLVTWDVYFNHCLFPGNISMLSNVLKVSNIFVVKTNHGKGIDFALTEKRQYYEIEKASVVLILEFQWSYESVWVEAGIENSNHKKVNQNKNVLNLHLWWVYCKANLFPWLIKSSGWIFISISLLVFRFLRAEHWEGIKISASAFRSSESSGASKKKN